MNWRWPTFVNAAIAFVTVSAVCFDVFRAPHRGATARQTTMTESAKSHRSRAYHFTESAMGDISDARVDDFASVPPSEFYEVLLRATPAEIAALALKFNELPNNGHTVGALGMFFQAWAELDGPSALEGAFRIKNVGLRRMAADTVLHSASPAASPELAAFLKARPDKDLMAFCKNQFLDTVLDRWATIDPVGAAKFLEDIGDTKNPLVFSASQNIAFTWGSLDPVSALTWIEKQDSQDPGSLLNSVISGWSKNDAAAAGAYIIQHLDGPGASEAVSSVASAMLDQDPQSATSWLNNIPPGEARMNAERRLAAEWAQKDPLAAAQWAENLSKDESSAAVNTIAGVWTANNWTETRTWLATLSGDFRDAAITGAIGDYQTDIPPTESLPLALSMIDKEGRIAIVRNIIRQWAGNEPQLAESWIRNSTLSREEKQELLSLDVFSPERALP
jgi:hypothetical protein